MPGSLATDVKLAPANVPSAESSSVIVIVDDTSRGVPDESVIVPLYVTFAGVAGVVVVSM